MAASAAMSAASCVTTVESHRSGASMQGAEGDVATQTHKAKAPAGSFFEWVRYPRKDGENDSKEPINPLYTIH